MASPHGHRADPPPLPRPADPSPAWRDVAAAWAEATREMARRHRTVVLIAGAVVVVLGAGLAGLLVGRSRAAAPPIVVEELYPRLDPGTVDGLAPDGLGPDTPAPPVTPDAPGTVVVHVAGAVVTPGVYDLPAAARVTDAIDAAGGARADADLDRINLAARLADGGRVYVPRPGEPIPAATGTGSGAGPGAPGGDGPAAGGPIDLNTAGATALESLPGIGPTTAAAILAHRDAHGPFASVDDLLEVTGIGPAKLAGLRDLVAVS